MEYVEKEMISKNKIIKSVIENKKIVEKFLGYSNREVPNVVKIKIDEELEKFGDLLDIEYQFIVDERNKFAELIYTVGDRIDKDVSKYSKEKDMMRAMILDKIGVVALDMIKEEIVEKIFEKYFMFVTKEIYPGNKDYGIGNQRDIFNKMDKIKNITINEYDFFYPLKTVAVHLKLSEELEFVNRCSDCVNKCNSQKTDEEALLEYFNKKAKYITPQIYKKLGLSKDIYEDNIKDIEIWAKKYESKTGTKGISQENYNWLNNVLDGKIIKFGRLQFEVEDNKDDIYKETNIETKNDIFINVHIREGEDFSYDSIKESYKRAYEFYAKHDERIVFLCDSWLMNKKLKEILCTDSNIIKFQEDYIVFCEDINSSQAEERVFGEVKENKNEYIENTTLQRKLKEKLLQGEKFGTVKAYYIWKNKKLRA